MIPFDFEYYRPNTLKEAFDCYWKLASAHKNPRYYSGGTELISMARVSSIVFDAVIDLKEIPECRQLALSNGEFVIGSAVTLTQIAEQPFYPLLSKTVKRIADHTIQGKLTIGGNLAGTIKYREAALPLMICDCNVKLMTQRGLTEVPFMQVFDGRLNLEEGEFLVSVSVGEYELHFPHCHVKKTKVDKIDYPLISMAATKAANRNGTVIRAAIAGYADRPVLLPADLLNDESMDLEKRIKKTIKTVNDECEGDLSGSKEYKEFVLENILGEMYREFADA